MNLVYLQCDCRYNQWLLKEITKGGYAVEHIADGMQRRNVLRYRTDFWSCVEYTINVIQNLNCSEIIAGIYDCEENKTLADILERKGVTVILSDIDNVNARFLSIVTNQNANYIVRVGGDQVLVDVKRTNHILKEMEENELDWFMGNGSSRSILPDIVSVECLKKHWNTLIEAGRYFEKLQYEKDVKRYILPYPCVLLGDFRANSNEHFRVCKKIIEEKLDVFGISEHLASSMIDKNNYLNQTGLWGSWLVNDFFYDEERNINPWWGRCAIDFIKPRLKKEWSVFEWGAGNSTLFWSKNVSNVVSVEYDKNWYEKIKEVVPSNVKLLFCELEYNGNYCRKILEQQEDYDIILIDGRDRVRCAINAVQRLKSNGVIIWDNSDREYYDKGYEYLKESGFKEIKFRSEYYGRTAVGMDDYTSIFYKKDNIFEI